VTEHRVRCPSCGKRVRVSHESTQAEAMIRHFFNDHHDDFLSLLARHHREEEREREIEEIVSPGEDEDYAGEDEWTGDPRAEQESVYRGMV
jgi:hypothetical protein